MRRAGQIGLGFCVSDAVSNTHQEGPGSAPMTLRCVASELFTDDLQPESVGKKSCKMCTKGFKSFEK